MTVYNSFIQKESICTEITFYWIKTGKIHVHQYQAPGCLVTEFCTMTPNIGGSQQWNLLHCHTSGSFNVDVAPRFLKYLWTPDLIHGAEVANKHCIEHVCKSLFPNMNNKQGRQCMYNLNIKAHSCNHCGCGRAISTAYSECVFVALLIQHAMHTCCVILSSVDSPALQNFSTSTHKEYNVQKKVTEHKKYVFILIQLLSATFLILRRNWRDIIINVSRSSCIVTIIRIRS
jgi:hypothetical protein